MLALPVGVYGSQPDPDITAIVAAAPGISAGCLTDLETMIQGLKADSLWNILDFIFVITDDGTGSRLNLRDTSESLTDNGTVSFVADTYLQCLTNSDFMNTPAELDESGSTNALKLDNTLFCSTKKTNVSVNISSTLIQNRDFVSGTHFAYMANLFGGDHQISTLKQVSASPTKYSDGDMPVGFDGFYAATRRGVNDVAIHYKLLLSSAVYTTFNVTETALALGSVGTPGDTVYGLDGEVRAGGYGAGMTSSQLTNLQSRINTYLSARGAI